MPLSFSQLEQLWIQAGGPPSVAPTMASIALAESSGNPNAINPTDNNGSQTSWGLWQISNGTHAPVSSTWNSPLTNAQLAVQKFNSQGLGAWGTYTSGSYLHYLPQGSQPLSGSYSGPTGTNASFTSTSNAPTVSLGAIGTVFQQVDRVLNPVTSVKASLLGSFNTSTISMAFTRSLFTIGGLGIMYLGFSTFTKGGSSGGQGALKTFVQYKNAQTRQSELGVKQASQENRAAETANRQERFISGQQSAGERHAADLKARQEQAQLQADMKAKSIAQRRSETLERRKVRAAQGNVAYGSAKRHDRNQSLKELKYWQGQQKAGHPEAAKNIKRLETILAK